MKARLAQLRLRSVQKRALERALAAIGAAATVGGVFLLLIDGNAVARGAVVAVCTLAAVVAAYRQLPRPEVHLVHPNGAQLWITTADLFDTAGEPVAITTNTNLDVGQVTARSLMRQLVDRWFDGDEAPVRAALGVPDGAPGREAEVPVGTVAELVRDDRHVLFLAVSQRDRDTTSSVVVNDVWTALLALWAHARQLGCARISVPVIGSGMSNARVDQPTLLLLLMASYVAAAHESRDTCPVRVVLHGRPDQTLALVELAVDFGGTLGFSQSL